MINFNKKKIRRYSIYLLSPKVVMTGVMRFPNYTDDMFRVIDIIFPLDR